VVYMFCNRNKLIGIWHGAQAMVQHSDLHVIPWFKLRPVAFWIQQSFDGWLIECGINHKNIKGKKGHKYYATICNLIRIYSFSRLTQGRRGRDRMVVGFTTTYAISSYHH